MKKIFFAAFILLFNFYAFSQTEIYYRASISLDGKSSSQLAKLGVDITEGDYIPGKSFTSDFSNEELEKFTAFGFSYKILINDVSSYYENQTAITQRTASSSCNVNADPVYPVPVNFSLGSMGGYLTYAEMLDNLDSMASKYPNLISIKAAIPGGTTINGESLYYVKISDNPNIAEAEPQVLYTALHHAREPAGMSALIYYMWYILEHYQSDNDINELINSTEMYFVPCVNPDGYLYNESTNPNGGGLWRKNRKDNGDGSYGIDLNRNYGTGWGYDDFGSSPFTSNETYRGDSAFSEKETQLMKSFSESHNFRIALNYHTYGNLLIYPWGYVGGFYTPDSATFVDYADQLTKYNHLGTGTSNQTVGYLVNGGSDDWMYGEQSTKAKILAMTPEVGNPSFGFWPPSSEIIPICQNNMYQNIMTARLAGHLATLKADDNSYVSNLIYYQNYSVYQLGLDTIGNYTVSITPISSNIISTGAAKVYSNLNSFEKVEDSLLITLSGSIFIGDTIEYAISIYNGQFVQTDTIVKYFGNPSTLVNDPCTNLNDWDASAGTWGITTESFVTSPTSIADSPFSLYQDNEYNVIDLANQVSLSNCSYADIQFNAKWQVERDNDYVELLISIDNGVNWTPLCGKYTKTGLVTQDPGEPVYEGYQYNWVQEKINLSDYIGQSIKLRFLLVSDFGGDYDGFYFDDFKIQKILVTGLNEANAKTVNAAYPNPANDYLTIPIKDGVKLSIYNNSGKLVYSQLTYKTSDKLNISVKSYNDGLYNYSLIKYDNTIVNGRFIVSH